MAQRSLPFFERLTFAFAAFFRILFDGAFAERLWRAREIEPSSLPPKPSEPPPQGDREENGALLLLSILQREGRLVDFLEQEIASFSDADIGAAARAVHEGARRALHAHATLEPARSEKEGAQITLQAGFDASSVKLTGNVRGAPPHTGTLKHPGWRAKEIHLPKAMEGHDLHVIAPAEVEL
ncbi:MAG: DUF2760 domain-containing protein [Polyangiaceae bacterium]